MSLPFRQQLSKLKQQLQFAQLAWQGQAVYTTEVDLDTVLLGEQCGKPLETWVERTGEWDRVSCPLADSPYVTFLEAVSRQPSLVEDDEFLESQAYYQMARTAIEFTGSYFGGSTTAQIKQQMRRFHRAYLSIRDGSGGRAGFSDFRHSAPGDPLLMIKVRDANCYEVSDGHHRAAIHHVLGRRRVTARIAGAKSSYLQTLVRQCLDTSGGLRQPIDKLDVRDWPVRASCVARWQAVKNFLLGSGIRLATALDADCEYGWRVDQLNQLGIETIGLSPSPISQKIGGIAYRLRDGCLQQADAAAYLPTTGRRFDLVFGKRACPLLQAAAAQVLVLELQPGIDETAFRSTLLRETPFRRVVVLAPPKTASRPQQGSLVACIR